MKPVVKVIQTAKNEKQAWRKLDDLELFKYYNFRMNTVSVDSSISYQKLLGFGGAFTEAAAYTWANADEKSKDEIGTPFCVTYDFDSEEDGAVTVRDRDTMEQERIKIEDLKEYFEQKFEF